MAFNPIYKTGSRIFSVEATGNLWENLYSFLERYKVIILNPYQTRKYHQVLSKKAKTDKVDSLIIAGFLRSKEALVSYVPEDEVQVLRELLCCGRNMTCQFELVKPLTRE